MLVGVARHYWDKLSTSIARTAQLLTGSMVPQLHPGGCVIARSFPASYVAIDAGACQSPCNRGIEKQVINAQARIARIRIAEVIPECIDLFIGMQDPYGIGPSLGEQSCERLTYLDPEEGIVDPALRFVDIPLRRNDVVIAVKDHRVATGDDLAGMGDQAIKPAQFVVELRARGGVAAG